MSIRIGINGFGRMGKLGFRAGWDNPAYQIVHINEIQGDAACHAHLMEFDSVHGRWERDIQAGEDHIMVDGRRVGFSMHREPGDVDWAGMGIDIVLECTGQHKTAQALQPYFDQGVKKVVVSAPVPEPALNIVYGINHEQYDPALHQIVTAASCTTNCLAPVIKVLNEGLGIRHGCMTTIHDITNTQTIVDIGHKDLRRARACGSSLIPTTTGSAKAITKIFPELGGRLNGLAVRVPLTNGSLTDLVIEAARQTSAEEVNRLFEAAAEGPLKGILGYEERPLVSIDYSNEKRSSVVDAPSTMVVDGTQVKVLAWYDNEWGFSARMADVAAHMGRLLN